MNPEVLLAAGYAALLTLGAFVLEWLSAHTRRRSLRFRTAGFTYDDTLDHWECPEGEHLWPLMSSTTSGGSCATARRPTSCNGCPRKQACTDSDAGREIVRPLDPWPHSEAGRFHRGISLVMIVLERSLTLAVEGVRHHRPAEAALLLAPAGPRRLGAGRWLLRDFRSHPAGFPEDTTAQARASRAASCSQGRR